MSQAEAQVVARFSGRASGAIGRFTGRPEADRWIWDDVVATMLGRTALRATSLNVLLEHIPPAERGWLLEAVNADANVAPCTVSCQLRAVTGEHRSVLILMETAEEMPVYAAAAPPSVQQELTAAVGRWIVGHLIDLTQLRLGAAQQASAHAVEQAVKHRSVIEQAKGMLMLTQTVDADAAFQMLVRQSQNTNTKLHVVAAEVIAESVRLTQATIPTDDPRCLDHRP